MVFRGLVVSAAVAALLGLAASGLVRAKLPAILTNLVAIPMPFLAVSTPSGPIAPTQPPVAAPAPLRSGPTTSPILVTKQTGKSRTSSRRARVSKQDAFAEKLIQGIRKRRGRAYEIKAATLEFALRNLPRLAKSVRVAPERREGKGLGFRLFAIKADGPFAKLGLRNNDVLVSVNGLSIATLDQALEVYRKLRTAHDFVLGIVRAGQKITQNYTIR